MSAHSNYDKVFLRYKENKEKYSSDKPKYKLHQCNDLKKLLVAFATLEETTAGPDDISVSFVKHLPHKALDFLLDLFNMIWNQHKFPKLCKTANIIPILESNKPS